MAVVKWRCVTCAAEYHDVPPPSCTRCIGGGLVQLPTAWGGRTLTHAPRQPRVISALGLRATAFAKRPASPLWEAIFGKDELPERAVIGLSGIPSSGKSTLALRLAEDGAFQKPIYVAGEEGLSSALADRASRVEATLTSFCDATNLPEVFEALGEPDDCAWDLLLLDSITTLGLTASDLGVIAAHYRITTVAVCQSRKDGSFKGSQQLLHEAHAWVELGAERTFKVAKSWWGELREGQIPSPGEA